MSNQLVTILVGQTGKVIGDSLREPFILNFNFLKLLFNCVNLQGIK